MSQILDDLEWDTDGSVRITLEGVTTVYVPLGAIPDANLTPIELTAKYWMDSAHRWATRALDAEAALRDYLTQANAEQNATRTTATEAKPTPPR